MIQYKIDKVIQEIIRKLTITLNLFQIRSPAFLYKMAHFETSFLKVGYILDVI